MTKTLQGSPVLVKAGLALLASLAVLAPSQAQAQAELHPGYITGTVTVAGHAIDSAYMAAYWTAPDGTYYSTSSNVSGGGSYTLTVNVPPGTTPTYTVNASVYVDGYRYYLNLPSQTVGVTEGGTSAVNFSITPGYVAATVTGAPLSSGYFFSNGGGGYSQASFGSGGSATFPVVPSDSVNVYGYVYFQAGGYQNLDYQTVSVMAGQTVEVSWAVTPPVIAGAISGTLSFNGATPDQTYIQAYSGGNYGSTSLAGNGPYQISNLAAGNYYVYAYSYFNSYQTYLQYPDSGFSPNRYPTVTSGATQVDISANAAFLTGRLSLTGARSLSQASSASMSAYGASGSPASGGYASTQANLQTGAYSFVLTDGGWSPAQFSFSFYDFDQASYLNEYLSFFDYQSYYNPISLTSGQTVTRNVTYGTGTVTVNFTALGGATFSSPYLTGSCYRYDENHQLVWYYYLYSYGNASNVTQAGVSFVGMAGTCTLDARANAGGSDTKFGTVTVEVVPGGDVIIDIGGPSLSVTFPEAGYITSNAAITVTGTSTDDVAVVGVTVNGAAAALDPAAPAPSVNFSSPVSLNMGPNEIVTVATDGAGKFARDRRTVYRDEGPPVLAWTPPDQSVSHVADIVVDGTATDDAGIASVTVNGVVVYESPDAGSGPTQVSFSTPFTLLDGDNFLEVVATDISTRTTAQTHKVTLSDEVVNQPPTAAAGGPYSVNEGGSVAVGAAGSDPEGTPLSYAWDLDNDGSFETPGQSVAFSAAMLDGPSTHTVTVRVTDDGGLYADASTVVSVLNVAPVIVLTPASTTIDEHGTATVAGVVSDPGVADAQMVTINFGDGSSTSLTLDPGVTAFSVNHQYLDDNPTGTPSDTYTVGATVTDDDGGAGLASASVTVNNVAPVVGAVTGPAAPQLVGTAVSLSASVTDPGTLDTFTCSIAWGDGAVTTGDIASNLCSGSHAYSAAGVYAPTVTVTDDDTGSGQSIFQYVVVYDPSGGFVTGGGWINSPAGAYAADPALTGRANFGFVAKYQRGATVPAGQTQFQFKAGNLNFHSTEYEWLVVAGERAQYKGSGTINGAGDYGFLLTLVDGGTGASAVDKFRIKIFDRIGGGVVYDNKRGQSDDLNTDPQAIAGGSIVIHR